MSLTAGELITYLKAHDPRTSIVVDAYLQNDSHIRVEDINITSAQGSGPDDIEREIFWDYERTDQ